MPVKLIGYCNQTSQNEETEAPIPEVGQGWKNNEWK